MHNNLKLVSSILLLSLIALPAKAFDFESLFSSNAEKELAIDAAQQFAKSQGANISGLSSLLNNPAVQNISNQLGVTSTQAAAGAAGLLTLAAQKLNFSQRNQLLDLVPQLASLSTLIPPQFAGKLQSLVDVKRLFGSLGMDPALTSQFVPLLTNVLGQIGANRNLLTQLNRIWK